METWINEAWDYAQSKLSRTRGESVLPFPMLLMAGSMMRVTWTAGPTDSGRESSGWLTGPQAMRNTGALPSAARSSWMYRFRSMSSSTTITASSGARQQWLITS